MRPAWAFPALLAVVVFALYGSTLTFDFVNYDDYDLVVMNTAFLSDPSNILTAFTTHAFTTHREESVYYRPFLLLTYFLDYGLWGIDPLGYHLTNVLLHAGAVVALYYLVLTMLGGGWVSAGGSPSVGRDRFIAFFAALLFAVHPVQTESVAWIAGRNDILLGLLLICSFLCHARVHVPGPYQSWMFPLSAVLFAAALLTKETAMFFVPLYPLYELLIRRERFQDVFSGKNHLRASTVLAIAAVYLVVRFQIFGEFIGAEKLYGKIPLDNRLLMAPGLAFVSLIFLAWPSKLSVVHPIENVPWFEWPAILAACAACLTLAGILWYSWKRDGAAAWALAWLAAGMLPLLNILPLAVPILEHRLYAASAGFTAAIAIGVSRLFGPMASPGAGIVPAGRGRGEAARALRPVPATAILATACIVLSAATWLRLPVWASSESLWLDAIDKEPEGARSYFNLAGYYFEHQRFDLTTGLLEKYIELRPDDFTAYTKLRQTYFLTGKPMDAARVCRTMIERDPTNANRYIEAGILFEKLGISDSVIAIYHEGVAAVPNAFAIHKRLGSWYQGMGNAALAAEQFAAADSIAAAYQAAKKQGRVP